MLICSLCQSEVLLRQCFRDRAVTMDLKKATIPCPWEGRSEDYKVRMYASDVYSSYNTIIIMQDHAETSKSQGAHGSQEQVPGSERAVYVSNCGCIFDQRKQCKNRVRECE